MWSFSWKFIQTLYIIHDNKYCFSCIIEDEKVFIYDNEVKKYIDISENVCASDCVKRDKNFAGIIKILPAKQVDFNKFDGV